MIDWPIGPTDAAKGQNAVTAHVDYIHFDGGCGLTPTGTRATNCLIPTLTDQDEIFTDLGFYFADLKLQPFVRFEWNGFVDDIDHSKDSRLCMWGFNYYVVQQNLKITAAYEWIVPNVVGATTFKQKNTNHFVLQLQFFYFWVRNGVNPTDSATASSKETQLQARYHLTGLTPPTSPRPLDLSRSGCKISIL